VLDGENGYLCNVKDEESLFQAVNKQGKSVLNGQ